MLPLSSRKRPRPAIYLAPSWSWAGMNNGVEPWWVSGEKQSLVAALLYVEVERSDADLFGPVTSASIVLKGRIFPAHWEHTRRALDADLTLSYGPRGHSEKYRTHPDALDDILEEELYFLPIFPPISLPSVPSDQAEIVNELFATMGIILNRVPIPLSADQSLEYFRRVGVLRLSRDKSREVLAEFQVPSDKVITIF